jgi:tetratricopeptide (TPR) repeat protein
LWQTHLSLALATMTMQLKNLLLTFILFGYIHLSFGQNELDISYDSIKAQIENKDSDSYYPKLLEKYQSFDSSLTLYDYALIYYGFTFQKDYIINKPNEETLKKAIESENFKDAVKECELILNKNPVSLLAINYLGFALFKLKEPESAWRKYQDRYRTLRKVIVYSGDGSSPETAFKVIYVTDEYNILNDYFEISKIHDRTLVGLCDKFIVDPSDYYLSNEVFFDISRKLIRQQEILDQK